ncbi:MAG TPA: deoxyribose-phosphate aldolase [Allocoleopsis sp.]
MATTQLEIDIAPLIDHSLLIPSANPDQVSQWCDEAIRYNFASVCVYPVNVRQVTESLRSKSPKVCTVIGFPTGATTPKVKLYESLEAMDNGAQELDVVINLAWLKMQDFDKIQGEIGEICEETGAIVKAIIETALLTNAEKRLAAEICMDAGVQFIKTSTGWHGGATVEDVTLLKQVIRDRIGIKASGGIATIDQAYSLIMAGATRLGTSRGVDLILQQEQNDDL